MLPSGLPYYADVDQRSIAADDAKTGLGDQLSLIITGFSVTGVFAIKAFHYHR